MMGKTETLRRLVAKQLNQPETKIDLISAGLAMSFLSGVYSQVI